MCGRWKIARDRLVTSFALFGTHELSARNARRGKNRAFGRAAREQDDSKRGSSSDAPPEEVFAFTVEPLV